MLIWGITDTGDPRRRVRIRATRVMFVRVMPAARRKEKREEESEASAVIVEFFMAAAAAVGPEHLLVGGDSYWKGTSAGVLNLPLRSFPSSAVCLCQCQCQCFLSFPPSRYPESNRTNPGRRWRRCAGIRATRCGSSSIIQSKSPSIPIFFTLLTQSVSPAHAGRCILIDRPMAWGPRQSEPALSRLAAARPTVLDAGR